MMFQGGLEIASSLVHGSEPRQSSSHTQLVTVVPEELEAFSVTLHGLVQVSDRFVDTAHGVEAPRPSSVTSHLAKGGDGAVQRLESGLVVTEAPVEVTKAREHVTHSDQVADLLEGIECLARLLQRGFILRNVVVTERLVHFRPGLAAGVGKLVGNLGRFGRRLMGSSRIEKADLPGQLVEEVDTLDGPLLFGSKCFKLLFDFSNGVFQELYSTIQLTARSPDGCQAKEPSGTGRHRFAHCSFGHTDGQGSRSN